MNESTARRPAPEQRRPQRAPQRPVAKKNHKPARVGMFYKNPGRVSIGFVATLAVIVVFGLIMLFSASYATAFYKFHDSYEYIRSQVVFAIVGSVAMWLASRVDYHWIRQFSWPLYGVVLALLVLVLFMPPIKGCRRWINVEHLPTIQVSEIAKFALILVLAHLFDRYWRKAGTFRMGIMMPSLILLPILALLYLEPHNSAMVLMCCIAVAIMFAGGCKLRWFVLGILGGLGGMAALIMARPGYVQERLQGWLDPFSDMMDSTRQTGQSLYTIGSGGLFGVGIGNSVQKHSWLPEPQNDFIFAILCEELGFVGACICIALFALLVIQGLMIALRAPDRFGCLLVIGTIAQVGFQFLFNIAVVTNLLPNTGISLPFFSAGGTSLLLLMGQMGIVLSVCRAGNKRQDELAAKEQEEKEKAREEEKQRAEENRYSKFDY